MLRLGPGLAAVEVKLPATLKTGALGSEFPVAGALGSESEGVLESELAGALGSVSVGALESELAGSCLPLAPCPLLPPASSRAAFPSRSMCP